LRPPILDGWTGEVSSSSVELEHAIRVHPHLRFGVVLGLRRLEGEVVEAQSSGSRERVGAASRDDRLASACARP
jgi:hypothetical protein